MISAIVWWITEERYVPQEPIPTVTNAACRISVKGLECDGSAGWRSIMVKKALPEEWKEFRVIGYEKKWNLIN